MELGPEDQVQLAGRVRRHGLDPGSEVHFCHRRSQRQRAAGDPFRPEHGRPRYLYIR
jgi:hypothetical protein